VLNPLEEQRQTVGADIPYGSVGFGFLSRDLVLAVVSKDPIAEGLAAGERLLFGRQQRPSSNYQREDSDDSYGDSALAHARSLA
jgi:hypothetical protein